MSSLTLARLASRILRSRRGQRSGPSLGTLKGAPAGLTYTSCFSSSARMESSKGAMGHEDETFEEFTARYDRHGTGREVADHQEAFPVQELDEISFRSSID